MEKQDTARERQPWWLVLCWSMIGLGFDWHSPFLSFYGRYSIFSTPVLHRIGLIVVLCAAVALLAVFVLRQARWRDAGIFFCLVSGLAYGHSILEWIVHK
jgi:hypothetical protein